MPFDIMRKLYQAEYEQAKKNAGIGASLVLSVTVIATVIAVLAILMSFAVVIVPVVKILKWICP